MAVANLLGRDVELSVQIAWATRFALARAEELVLLLPVQTQGKESVIEIDLGASPGGDESMAVGTIRELIEASAQLHVNMPEADGESSDPDEPGESVPVRLRILKCKNLTRSIANLLLAEIKTSKIELLSAIRKQYDATDSEVETVRRQFLRRVPCDTVHLIVGSGDETAISRILVPAARGPHGNVALGLALELAARYDGQVTALRINRDIGLDAEAVGEHALEQIVRRAVGKDHEVVRRRVVVDDNVVRGIRRECDATTPDLILVGASKSGVVGRQIYGTIGTKLLRSESDTPIALVRAGSLVTNRMGQLFERNVQRLVPQLERENRIELVERIQSNSQWDFDFFALMTLSTFIASMGLVQNSAAVVIGAMLVAPLMTPLLGLGIALVQGNPVFARMAFRSVFFGFLVAFGVGVAVGFFDMSFREPTPEILARGWPGLLDLFVAFAAGMAAAYASCRPSLLAALPGVAIAAALVPPIGSAGLALSLGEYRLAWGALLLFLVNMVTIVVASTIALWAVGIRGVKKRSRFTMVVRTAMIVAVLALAVQLSLTPPKHSFETRLPPGLTATIERQLGAGYRLYGVDVSHSERGVELIVRVSGDEPVTEELADAVRAIARDHFDESVQVRMVTRFEVDPDQDE